MFKIPRLLRGFCQVVLSFPFYCQGDKCVMYPNMPNIWFQKVWIMSWHSSLQVDDLVHCWTTSHKKTYYTKRNILHHEKSAKFLMVVVNFCRGVPCIYPVNDCLSAVISSKFEMAAGIEHFCEMLPIVLICPCGWPQRAFFLWHHEPLSEEQFWWWW